MEKRIVLNVGGRRFETTVGTLVNGSDYFKAMIERWNITNNGEIFIDRSGKIFEHVLCLLRDPNYDYPIIYKNELEFYQINVNNTNDNTSELPNVEKIPTMCPERIQCDIQGKHYDIFASENINIIKKYGKWLSSQFLSAINKRCDKWLYIANSNIVDNHNALYVDKIILPKKFESVFDPLYNTDITANIIDSYVNDILVETLNDYCKFTISRKMDRGEIKDYSYGNLVWRNNINDKNIKVLYRIEFEWNKSLIGKRVDDVKNYYVNLLKQ